MNLPEWDTLTKTGEVPPPSPETLAHAHSAVRRAAAAEAPRRRHLVPLLAAAAVAAAIVGTLVVNPFQSDPPPPVAVDQPTPAVPAPTASTTIQVSGSCRVSYSLEELKKVGFAFDGTVVSAVRAPGVAPMGHTVTFTVHRWFKGNGGQQVRALIWLPPQGGDPVVTSSVGPEYSIGSRMLVSGSSIRGGPDPLKDPVVWGCDFTRPYTASDAATWQKVFGK